MRADIDGRSLGLSGLGQWGRGGLGQPSANLGYSRIALLVAQETEVANFDEPFGQQMQTESADKLLEPQRHRFLPGVMGVILPFESDRLLLLIQGEQAARADRDPMGVARQISQNLVWSGKRPFGIDVPFVAGGLTDELLKRPGLG